MSLEADIKELLWSAVADQAAGIDALASGSTGVEVTDRQLVQEVVIPAMAAQGEALVRLARAIDALT